MKMLGLVRKKEPRSDLYKAGYAMGTTAGILIREYMTPPDALLPTRDAPGEWCDGYSAGLNEVSNRRRRYGRK